MSFTDNRIAFPVADSRFMGNNSWTFINADAVGNASPAILFAVSLTTFLLATQMFMEITSLMFVSIDMEVNPFVAARDTLFCMQAPGNLFQAPEPRYLGGCEF